MKLHRNINASLVRLEKFIFTEWIFTAKKTDDLHNWLTNEDQRDFNLSVSSIDWPTYFYDLSRGARIYLSLERLDNLRVAKKKDTM